MLDVNKVILIGRLGAEPISRATRSGICVAHLSVATAHRVRPDAKEQVQLTENQSEGIQEQEVGTSPSQDAPNKRPCVEQTVWHKVIVWGQLASHCNQYLHKGSPVYIEGGIRSRKWKGADAQPRTSYEIHADQVIFLPDLRRISDTAAERRSSANHEADGESSTPATEATAGIAASVFCDVDMAVAS